MTTAERLRDERETEVREMLDTFVPDLLSERRNKDFVSKLFQSAQGRWLSVERLCRGIVGAEDFFQRLSAMVENELLVVWLDHPHAESNYGYVHFYLEDYFWTTSAIYNLARTMPADR